MLYIPIIIQHTTTKKYNKKICELNKQAEAYLSDKQFNITKDICFNFSKNYIQHMLIDLKSRQICFFDYENNQFSIFNFCDLIGFQIVKNNDTIMDSETYYNISSLYPKEDLSACHDLKLIVKTSSLNNPRIVYTIVPQINVLGFFNAFSINEHTNKFKNYTKFLEDFISFYETLSLHKKI